MDNIVWEKTNTRACISFAHGASVRERLGTNIASENLLPTLAWTWHDTCICKSFAPTFPHVCKYHANGHGTDIAYPYANLLPQNKTGIGLACVSVGIGLARPCNNRAILAWVSANLLPRLLGMTIAWSLVNLLPGFTGLPYTPVCMGKKMTSKIQTQVNPRPIGPGVPGSPPTLSRASRGGWR